MECDLNFFSISEEAKASAAYASAAASVVLSTRHRGYRIPPGKKLRYAARGYIYPMRRATKDAVMVDTVVVDAFTRVGKTTIAVNVNTYADADA